MEAPVQERFGDLNVSSLLAEAVVIIVSIVQINLIRVDCLGHLNYVCPLPLLKKEYRTRFLRYHLFTFQENSMTREPICVTLCFAIVFWLWVYIFWLAQCFRYLLPDANHFLTFYVCIFMLNIKYNRSPISAHPCTVWVCITVFHTNTIRLKMVMFADRLLT